MRLATLLGYVLVLPFVALAPRLAQAAPFVGLPSPVAGFEADDGTEVWLPNDAVVGVEGLDFFGDLSRFESSFGFYRASDPSTLITIFSPSDQDTSGAGTNQQLATIDFLTGQVLDVDELAVESFFTPGTEEIGFFLNVLDTETGDELTLYTQPALNSLIGGEDAFGSFRNTDEPDIYLLGAELSGQQLVLRVDLIDGVNPIPEPSAAVVFAAGFLVVGVAVRLRKSRSTA